MTTRAAQEDLPRRPTLHLPTDGRVLSADGRRYAEAEWNKCHMVPCNGAIPASDSGLTTKRRRPRPRAAT